MNNSESAKMLVQAIRNFNSNENALENLESYLSNHFDEWLKKWANSPENLASELNSFSKIC